jgi:hypothetical protein
MVGRIYQGSIVVILCFLLSCTVEQKQLAKDLIVKTAPKVVASIAAAYGFPYANLISGFFNSASTSSEQWEYAQQEGTYYQEQGYQTESQSGYAQQEGTYYQEQGYYTESQTGYGQQEGTYYQEQGYQTESQSGYAQETQYPRTTTSGEYSYGQVYGIPTQLEVQIDLLKEVYEGGRYHARPIINGDTLTRDDNYKVMFKSNIRCFMYVAQLDSTGKLDPIFPSSRLSWGNPLESQVIYSIPQDNEWFYLDENTGVETVYFIASRTRRPDLEELFRNIELKNQSLTQLAYVSIERPPVITRGIGGVRLGSDQAVKFRDGSHGQYSSTLFSSIQADFVMTRWFYHK